MTVPIDKKDQAVYHMILGEMHRLHAVLLNLQTLPGDETAAGLRDHFLREQTLVVGKLQEWKRHRAETYRQAEEDFGQQVRRG
ncbi:MAG TPA: hypothetical protein VKX16_09505 [Chloroflexota bacterium]|nr:hypothetical protein [Chloroflexota bacterium]